MTDVDMTAGTELREESGSGPRPAMAARDWPGHDRPRVATTIVCAAGQGSLAGGDRPDEFAPAGLGLKAEAGDAARFRITILGHDGGELLSFGPFADDDVVALWRKSALVSGLPLVLVEFDGTRHPVFRQLGRLPVGQIHARRHRAVMGGRRPRFLVRRKSARLPRRPLIHVEREMAGGNAG